MANWFLSSVGWTAVVAWAALTTYTVGDIRRQLAAPTAGNERVFRVDSITTGISGASEPSWTGGANITKNGTTTDAGVVWREVTGLAAYNTTSFAAPAARVKHIAETWAAAGDTIYMDDDHAETQAAAVVISGVGTNALPLKLIALKSTFANPVAAADITTTAVAKNIATSGANQLTFSGSWYCYGVNFCSGTSGNPRFDINQTNSTTQSKQKFVNCQLELGSASAQTLLMGTGATLSSNIWENVTIKLGAAASVINGRGSLTRWIGGALTGTAPTNMFGDSGLGDNTFDVEVRDVDLNSGVSWSGKFLVGLTNLDSPNILLKFDKCKINSTFGGVVTGSLGATCVGSRIRFVCSDSGATNYREEDYQYGGKVIGDTVQYRTGGSSDGTTPKGWQAVSLATAEYINPLYGPDYSQWVDTTGSKTLTMYIASGGTLKDTDVGFEVEYLGSSAAPLGTFATTYGQNGGAVVTTPNILAVGNNLASDGSTWNGSGVGTVQKVVGTLSIGLKGLIRIRPVIWKASQTVFIDPLIVVA